jgi:hypothetical protein
MEIKYRRLASTELNELEKEFVEYLVVNGISAGEWVRLKKDNLKKADRIIDLFSDVVFEGVFRKAKFLEHISADRMLTFQALSNKIIMVGIEDSTSRLDFTKKEILLELQKSIPRGIKIFKQEKDYQKQREVELFDMVQNGAQISDGSLFKQLSLLYASVKQS